MTKEEFIELAKECGYSEEEISDLIELVEGGTPIRYEDIVLINKPIY